MKRLEVITLRLASSTAMPAISEFLGQIKGTQTVRKPAGIRVYRHVGVDSDLSIHLLWESGAVSEGKSPLGLALSETLKAHGLLHHSIWMEESTDAVAWGE